MNHLAITAPQTSCGLLLIGADMASGKDESVVLNINEDEHSVREIVNSIMTLAMINSDVLHIHTSYSPHVNQLSVRVQPADTDYHNPNVFFKENIYLDKPYSLEQLKILEDLLIDLVADAKDLAIGAC